MGHKQGEETGRVLVGGETAAVCQDYWGGGPAGLASKQQKAGKGGTG